MPLFCITETEPSKMHNIRPCVLSRPWLKICNCHENDAMQLRESNFHVILIMMEDHDIFLNKLRLVNELSIFIRAVLDN